MKKGLIIFGVVTALLLILTFLFRDNLYKYLFKPTQSSLEQGTTEAPETSALVETIASDLQVPWALAKLPNGDLLVTERPGVLKRLGENNQTFEVNGVEHVGEGGLLGLALHPDFKSNSFLYIYLTTKSGDGLINRVERYTLNNDELDGKKEIISNIPGANYHDGGRIAFGPDGKLYITTGDAGSQDSAQDKTSLAGKILRLNDDGSIPSDNPFGNAVYSYGHRNPQGLAWDSKGQLWSTEHGPSGIESGQDELNLIKKGGNYGWPVIRGQQTAEGMISPVVQSGTDETWAPAGIAHLDGVLYFAGLRGASLYQAKINEDNTVNLKAYLRQDYGRLREVAVFDKTLLITTSNRDGRGNPKSSDDRIIRINPELFTQ